MLSDNAGTGVVSMTRTADTLALCGLRDRRVRPADFVVHASHFKVGTRVYALFVSPLRIRRIPIRSWLREQADESLLHAQ